MADDSTSQTVQDNQTSTTQLEDTVPSSQSQDLQPSTLIVLEDRSAGPDSNRPVSTIPADSVSEGQRSEVSVDTKPIDNLTSDSPPDTSPDSVTPVETAAVIPVESVEDESMPEIPVETKPADSPANSTNPADLINKNQVPVQPDQLSPQLNSDTGQNTGIPQNQAEQVQLEVPKDTSGIDTKNSGVDSARIQPKAPGSPQIVPIDEKISEKSNNLSFGDLLSGQSGSSTSPLPVQAPVTESPKPSVSFGDLIDDLKPKDISYDMVIPPTSSTPSNSPDPVSNTVQPFSVSPQPSSNPVNPPNSPTTQISQASPEPVIIEKPVEVIKEVIKEVPVEKVVEKVVEVQVVDENEVNKRTKERISQEVDSRLQKATQKRIEKREENLNKILQYIQSKLKVNNNDIRDYLRVSQTTATEYLHTLVESEKIRMEGKGKATIYHL